MARRVAEPRVLGRSQGGRPTPPALAAHQADSERALAGALSVPIEQIVPDPGQPRSSMDPDRLAELAASITVEGLLQPLVVREEGFLDDGRTRYVIVAGARRYAAAQQAGLSRVPVIVRESEGASLRVLQLTENLHREDLSEADEGRAFQELMDLEGLSPRGLAERLHVSDQHVRERLRLAADAVLAGAVGRGQIAASTAREIGKLPEDLRAAFRARVGRGERVQLADVAGARDQSRAQGQPPPRRTPGSGRKPISQTVFEKPPRAPSDSAAAPAHVPSGADQRPGPGAPLVLPAGGGQPTLRETGRALGATEEQIAAAAVARHEEPELTPAEAIALAMSAEGAFPGEATAPGAAQSAQAPSRAALPPRATLEGLVAAAGGQETVLRLLRWAAAQGLSLAQLIQAIAAFSAADD